MDRGVWSLEVMIVLLGFKLLMPGKILEDNIGFSFFLYFKTQYYCSLNLDTTNLNLAII